MNISCKNYTCINNTKNYLDFKKLNCVYDYFHSKIKLMNILIETHPHSTSYKIMHLIVPIEKL